jgi:hypothetical protein
MQPRRTLPANKVMPMEEVNNINKDASSMDHVD